MVPKPFLEQVAKFPFPLGTVLVGTGVDVAPGAVVLLEGVDE